MEYTEIATYVNWARLAALVLVAVLAVIGAIRRTRPKATKRDLAHGVFLLVVVAIMGVVSSATSWILVAFFAVIGLIVGLLLGRVRPFMAWIVAFCQIYFAMALFWDAGGYFAAGLAMLAFAAAASFAQGLRTRGTAASSASGDAGAVVTET